MCKCNEGPPARDFAEASVLEYLASHRVFGTLSATDLGYLATQMVKRTYPKGSFLRYQGAPSIHLFLVKHGLVALIEADPRGNQRLLVTFSPGDVLGLAGMVFGLPSSPAAMAVVDTVCLVLCKDVFDRLYRDCPGLAPPVMQEIFLILRRSQRTITRHAITPAVSRVAAFLLESSAGSGGERDGSEIDLALSHQDLALLLATTRETITRAFSRLSRTGLIAVSGHKVRILNADGLRRTAEG